MTPEQERDICLGYLVRLAADFERRMRLATAADIREIAHVVRTTEPVSGDAT